MNEDMTKPVYLAGGSVGLLALHGFTGAPAEMRPVVDHFGALGWTVRAPLLPGHGTEPEDLNVLTWQDWLAGAENEFSALTSECEMVFVAGLSMGSLLACALAHKHREIAGLMLYSPALRAANPWIRFAGLARHVMAFMPPDDPGKTDLTDPEAPGRLWHYPAYPVGGAAELFKLQRHVKSLLGEIDTPALIVASTQDASIHPRSAQMVHSLLGSESKELLMLHRSGHCLTMDIERERVLEASRRFARQVMASTTSERPVL